jgi:hypothetical protein
MEEELEEEQEFLFSDDALEDDLEFKEDVENLPI